MSLSPKPLMDIKVVACTVEILSPVHIGDGSTLEGYEYCVVDGIYHKINMSRLLENLPPDDLDNLANLMATDPIGLRKFMREIYRPEFGEYSCRATRTFIETVEGKLDDPRNQLLVRTFIKTCGQPYLPGSSIKGAIRTAVLANLLGERCPSVRDGAEKLERELLGYSLPTHDPMKGLRVADVHLSMDCMVVDSVQRWSSGATGVTPLRLQQLAELASPVWPPSGAGFGQAFQAEFRLYEKFLVPRGSSVLRDLWDEGFQWLAKVCNDFYAPLAKSDEKFAARGDAGAITSKIARQIEQAVRDGGCVMRLGWGSGLDSVSLNRLLRKAPTPRTKSFTGEGWPLGWIVLRQA